MVLMAHHFSYHPHWCSDNNQSVGSSTPLVSTCLEPGNKTFLEAAIIIVECPAQSAGNDPEALELAFHHQRHTFINKDLLIGPQEFVVGYSKAPEQPQSSARPICHSHAMTRTGREPAIIRIAA